MSLSCNRRRILAAGVALMGTLASPLAWAGRDADARLVFADLLSLRAFQKPALEVGRTLVVALENYYAGIAGGGGLFRWQANSNQVDDGGVVINPTGNASAGRWIRIGDSPISPLEFGARGDGGRTEDTLAIFAWLDRVTSTGRIGDGLGKTYRVLGTKTIAPTKTLHLRNLSIISGSSFASQFTLFLTGDVDYVFEDIAVDGERGSRKDEPWGVQSRFGGYSSIYPRCASFIRTKGAATSFTKTFTFRNFRLSNLHCDSGLTISTVGTVTINGLITNNLSNRAYAITHDRTTNAGTTVVSNVDTRDTGILPAQFLVDGAAKTRADAYAPQASFNGLVSFGRYFVTDYRCLNYGSCGLTADRNAAFVASNVSIEHNDLNAFSNNPSGAFWIENCARSTVTALQVKITARDARESDTDSSAVQVFLGRNAQASFQQLDIRCTTASVRKGLRGSNQDGAVLRLATASVSTRGPNSIDVANLSGYANAAEISLADVSADGPVRIRDSKLTKIESSAFGASLVLGGNVNKGGKVVMNGGRVRGDANFVGCDEEVNVDGTHFGSNLTIRQLRSSRTRQVTLNACHIVGITTIAGAVQSQVTNSVTERRIEFGDFQEVALTGNKLRTDRIEPIVWLNPSKRVANARAVLKGNALRIRSDKAGAAYIVWNRNLTAQNVEDTANEKLALPLSVP